MRFGLFGGARTELGNQVSDSRIYSDYVDYICEAEALGFHSVFLVEHHFTGFGQVSATLNFLTFLAAKTTTLRLGTAVLVLPWHNPALLAEQAATLDLLSNGRFDFGIGKGYRWGEFHGFCVAMDEAEERYQETVAFLKKAWTSQGRFSHHGKYWDYDDVVIEPAPVQKPHPPLWVGAQGRVFDASMVGCTRALHIAMNDDEREKARELRARFMANVQQLSLSPT